MNEDKYITLLVIPYSDFSVISIDNKSKEVKENYIRNAPLHLMTMEVNGLDLEIESILNQIDSEIKNKTLADVVITTIYTMVLNKKQYESVKNNILSEMKESDIILNIFKQNLSKCNEENPVITVLGTFPITLRDNINKTGLYN